MPLYLLLAAGAPDAIADKKMKKPMTEYQLSVERMKTMNEHDRAFEQLRWHDTWCEGAKTLARLGDRSAIVPIVEAYRGPSEGVDKSCLGRALQQLATPEAVLALHDHNGPGERRAAVAVMGSFPDEAYLGRLEQALTDGDSQVRWRARTSIVCQKQTPAWEAVMARLLDSEDRAVRHDVIVALTGHRRAPATVEALRARLAREPDPGLKGEIEKALATQ
jgi:HEAT repeat protein